MRLYIRLICSLGFLASLTISTSVWACDCMPVASTQEAVRNSTHVFAATITKKKRTSLPEIQEDYKEFILDARVIRYWKGQLAKTITIRTPASEQACGYDFRKGESYIIYATGGINPTVTVCSRSVPLKSQQGESDLRHLGKPSYP